MDLLLSVLAALLVALAGGFIWARATARLPVPELLRMLTSPIGAGLLCMPLLLAVFVWRTLRDQPHALGHVRAASLGALSGLLFKAGVAGCALPAMLGWMIGHRRNRRESSGDDHE